MRLFYLVLGGAAGTVSRYLLSAAIHENVGHGFPYGTLAVNGIGCLIIGLLSTLDNGRFFLDDNMKMLLAVGFCGAFTTFSTFMLETGNLIKDGEMFRAFLNVTVSLIIGFVVFRLGILIADII